MEEENNLNENELKSEATQILERINFWISNCDTKISFSLAFIGILLGGFFSGCILTGSLNNLVNRLKEIGSDTQYFEIRYLEFTAIVLIIFIISILVSLTCLFLAKKGRINASTYSEDGLVTDSKIYFGTIQGKTFLTFKNDLKKLDREVLLDDYLSQIYINSKICNRKFQLYNRGVNYLIISMFAFIILNVLLLFIG